MALIVIIIKQQRWADQWRCAWNECRLTTVLTASTMQKLANGITLIQVNGDQLNFTMTTAKSFQTKSDGIDVTGELRATRWMLMTVLP